MQTGSPTRGVRLPRGSHRMPEYVSELASQFGHLLSFASGCFPDVCRAKRGPNSNSHSRIACSSRSACCLVSAILHSKTYRPSKVPPPAPISPSSKHCASR